MMCEGHCAEHQGCERQGLVRTEVAFKLHGRLITDCF